MEYKAHPTTATYLQSVKSHTEPYVTEVLGQEIIVYPNVMSPKYDWSSRFHIENMPNQDSKSFLEIGCGSGVISLFAGLQGATKIFALDINPNAIENTKANLAKYNIKNFEVIESDVFENVRGAFDTINFAAPYHGNKPKQILEYGVSDPEYRALRLFLTQAHRYLNLNGQVILGFSNTGDTDLLNELIIKNEWVVKDFKEEENDGWKACLYVLEPIQFKNELQRFIYEDDYKYFKKYKDLILKGRILKVGYGLGYSSHFIKLYNSNITNLDIEINKRGIRPQDVVLYDGTSIPFDKDEFNTVLCTYTLHHTSNPEEIFSEIVRVSKTNVIVIEETYESFIQKIQEVYNCWFVNRKAGQNVKIFWKSYFSRKSIRDLFEKYNLTVVTEHSSTRRSFFVELFTLKKIALLL